MVVSGLPFLNNPHPEIAITEMAFAMQKAGMIPCCMHPMELSERFVCLAF